MTIVRKFGLWLVLLVIASGASAQSLTVNVNVFGLNENQFNANAALQSTCADIRVDGPGSAAAADLLATCDNLGPLDEEDPALAAALERLVPEEAFSLSDSLTDSADAQVSNVFSRITTVRSPAAPGAAGPQSFREGAFDTPRFAANDGPSSLDDSVSDLRESKLEVFVLAQHSAGDVDGADVQQNAGFSSSGLTIGADYRLTKGLVLGVGAGYSTASTVFDAVRGGSEREGIDLTLFGTYYNERSMYLDVVLDIGAGSAELERQINLPGSPEVLARASTDSSTYSLTMGVGRNFALGAWDFGPRARVGLSRSDVDAYQEQTRSTSAGFGSTLRVGAQEVRSGRVTLGTSLSRSIGTARGVVVPHLSLDLEYESEADKDDLEVRFVADPAQNDFSVSGTRRDRQYANVGAGITAVYRKGRSAYALYESRLQHDFITQHWLRAGGRVEF